ncbi:MAG: hypothetical protein LBV12_03650 [Puniceicoccales bacterium]|jgi:predicted acyltransferase|nr:hypothetical protein [Puniceicoccales bacterium]
MSEPKEAVPAAKPQNSATSSANKLRLVSLDALRGFDMFWLIGGVPFVCALAKWIDAYASETRYALSHAGFGMPPRAYDLVMPLFLFMSGVAMAFSGKWKNPEMKMDRARWIKVFRRVAILWILGMAVQGNLLSYDISKFYWYTNTLQSIAAGGLIAELVSLLPKEKWRLGAFAALPVLYWILSVLISPGRYAMETSGAIRLDDMLFGMDRGNRAYAWVLPSLNFGATVLMGVYTGRWVSSLRKPGVKTAGLFLSGILALGMADLWEPLHPINKHLWTGSFVLWSGGWCLMMMGFFYGIVDWLGWKRWTFPLCVIGMNSLAAYMMTSLLNFRPFGLVFIQGFKGRVSNECFEVLHSGATLAIVWLILYVMYRKKIFLKF